MAQIEQNSMVALCLRNKGKGFSSQTFLDMVV